MRILLFGAESKLACGYYIGQRLLAMGHSVAVSVKSDWRFDCGVQWIKGELDDASIQREISRADAVIDARAPVVVRSGNVKVNELRPCLLMRSLEGTGKRLIVTSDAHVLGETGATPVAEIARARPLRSYAWLARMEQKILHAGGVHTAVVRAAQVYGSSPLTLPLTAWLILARRRRRGTYIEPGTNCSSAVHCDDLADLYCLALHKAGAGTLIHAASEVFSMKELAGAIHRGMGKPGEASGISLEHAKRILPYAAALCGNMAVSGDMARRTLGWKPAGPSYLEEVEQEVRAPRIYRGSPRAQPA
jgi:nucleoside-diphosphate-sugar epimerase